MRRNILSVFIAAGSVLLGVLFVPIFSLYLFPDVPMCSLSVANAQDNPCLAQDATISAQEVVILQYQATNMALEDRIATLEAVGSGVAGGTTGTAGQGEIVVVSVPGLPFLEDFSDNENGWRLSPGISLVGGVLNLEGSRQSQPRVPIAEVGSNVYIAFDVMDYRGLAAIWLGDIDNVRFHSFEYSFGEITIYERTESDNVVLYGNIPTGHAATSPYRFAINYQNGQFDVYFNDEYVMTGQLTTFGGQIAIGFGAGSGLGFGGQIDNIEIRASR